MILDYQYIDLDGKKAFERMTFQSHGRVPKVLEDEACFLFLNKGSFSIRTQEESYDLLPREGFLSKCGEYFFEDIKEQTEPVEALGIYFQQDIVKEIFSSVNIRWDKNPGGKMDINPVFEAYKNGIMEYMKTPEVFSRDLILLKIKELILILAHSVQAPSIHHFLSSLFSRNETDLRKVVEKNIFSSLSTEQLAFLCGMSLATFKRRFQEVYKTSPAEYIRNRKLEKASQLLLNPDIRINEVAWDCGFESISTFNRAFRKKFGISPTEHALSRNEQ